MVSIFVESEKEVVEALIRVVGGPSDDPVVRWFAAEGLPTSFRLRAAGTRKALKDKEGRERYHHLCSACVPVHTGPITKEIALVCFADKAITIIRPVGEITPDSPKVHIDLLNRDATLSVAWQMRILRRKLRVMTGTTLVWNTLISKSHNQENEKAIWDYFRDADVPRRLLQRRLKNYTGMYEKANRVLMLTREKDGVPVEWTFDPGEMPIPAASPRKRPKRRRTNANR